MRQIPALLASGTVAHSIERGAGGVGQATLNLRQLGANRTLVLIDGFRHVSGVAGSQTVDVSTIPNALIERVDVLTGGASAVYGADAVTGVVNHVLKRDFTGVALDGQFGISDRGDGQTYRIEGTVGTNFADGKGNITFSAGYTKDSEVLFSDRPFTAFNGRGNNSTTYSHPDRRFQKGDIDAASMPNFASRYSIDAGRLPFGFAIPTAAQFTSLFPGQTPTAAEQALIARAANAPQFIIAPQPAFAISSYSGLLWRGDFGDFTADINNNGVRDCAESHVGLTAFGFGGACYVTTAGGGVKIFEDGIISTSQNQFGGDGAAERPNLGSLLPESQRIYANLRARYEISSQAEVFVDAKHTRNTAVSRNVYNTFYDSLLIFPENPFIPAVLQADADEGGGLRVSRDMTDLGDGVQNATTNRKANCIAAAAALGIANPQQFIESYTDPLGARFGGTIGGNPNLQEETATTWTVGTVIQPRFIPGLTMSADYYSIRIRDAIATVAAQDIVNTCYDNTQFPNQFCGLFERFSTSSPGFNGANLFGFRTLNQSVPNFGRIETSGVDVSVNDRFTLWDKNNISLGVNGNWTQKVNRFFDPTDPTLVNPALRELSVPEWSGVGSVTYNPGAFTLGYNVQFVQSTAVAGAIQIERLNEEFGPAGFAPDYWVHNINVNVDILKDRFSVYGGINNVGDAAPYLASSAYPVSGMGRFYFLGIRAKY